MTTLNSFFPEESIKGDGRKFTRPDADPGFWFEPSYKDADGYWHGLVPGGYSAYVSGTYIAAWQVVESSQEN